MNISKYQQSDRLLVTNSTNLIVYTQKFTRETITVLSFCQRVMAATLHHNFDLVLTCKQQLAYLFLHSTCVLQLHRSTILTSTRYLLFPLLTNLPLSQNQFVLSVQPRCCQITLYCIHVYVRTVIQGVVRRCIYDPCHRPLYVDLSLDLTV